MALHVGRCAALGSFMGLAALMGGPLACAGGPTTSLADADGDGFTTDRDCDDGDAAVNPDAKEICDGLDNDCNERIDDNASDAPTRYPDADGDGFGDVSAPLRECQPPPSYLEDNSDCDDDDPDSYPGAAERCDGLDNNCDGVVDDGVPNDGNGCQEPGAPTFDEVIDTLVITLRTGDNVVDGSGTLTAQLCLNAETCFPLDLADVIDRRRSQFDVYHFENLSLPRSEVDRVQLVTANGVDHWRPVCMQMQFDGEPVYCETELGGIYGNLASELEEWTDPAGVHESCVSCYPLPLSHGPLLGQVDDSTAKLLVRSDATRRIALRLGENEAALLDQQPVGWAYPDPLNDYAHTFAIQGLQPATSYSYSLEIEGVTTPPQRFTTAPAAGSPSVNRVAFGSCSRFSTQSIFNHVDAFKPDLFLFLGDSHYADSSDLSSLRWFYRWGLERQPRKGVLAHIPTLATWDDHDFVGDNSDGNALGKATALRAFREYWPQGAANVSEVPGVFVRHRWGDLDFFMLDDRYHRNLDGTLLGHAQTAWLEKELIASDATFKFLVSGSQWTAAGSSDSWASFPSARTALFDFIRDENIDGVVLLSGDVQRSEIRLIDRAAAGGYDLPELTASPLANTNFNCPASNELVSCHDDGNFFMLLDSDSSQTDPQLRVRIIGDVGDTRADWTLALSQLSM